MKIFRIKIVTFVILVLINARTDAADNLDGIMPVRGFCIAAPGPKSLDPFVTFVQNELTPRHVNTLILRVDYHYQYESHPELRENEALSKEAVKSLINVCRTNHI